MSPGSTKSEITVAIVAVALVVAAGLWLLLGRESAETQLPPAPPPKELFHAAKPLRLVVEADDAAWLNRELRYLLLRGRMQLLTGSEPPADSAFRLQVSLTQPAQARVSLLAPPRGEVERSMDVAIDPADRLATLQAFAKQLPAFLHAAQGADWMNFTGTQDAAAYESYLQSADELFAAGGTGFTQPPAAHQSAAVDRLEALVRKQPRFARAQALLAVAYLSLGGKDEASLTQLARSTAQRALSTDPALADAHAALGIASTRHGEWLTALEHFDAALALDKENLPALEGKACLELDAGYASAAYAAPAVKLQPGNIGANECQAYAQLSSRELPPTEHAIPEVARVHALAAILAGDLDAARKALSGPARQAPSRSGADEWTQAFLSAAADKQQTSAALRAITVAASDRQIDAATEILAGTALRQSEFVFNRMLRLHQQQQPLPLRVLWLPQTQFLREHPRFDSVIAAAGLLPLWQEHGPPEICGTEPGVHGCQLKKK